MSVPARRADYAAVGQTHPPPGAAPLPVTGGGSPGYGRSVYNVYRLAWFVNAAATLTRHAHPCDRFKVRSSAPLRRFCDTTWAGALQRRRTESNGKVLRPYQADAVEGIFRESSPGLMMLVLDGHRQDGNGIVWSLNAALIAGKVRHRPPCRSSSSTDRDAPSSSIGDGVRIGIEKAERLGRAFRA